MLAQTSRIAVYGPVRTVVWEGSAGDRRPYPDQDVNMRHPRTAPRGHSSALAAFKIPTIRSESTRRYEYNRIRFQPVRDTTSRSSECPPSPNASPARKNKDN